MRAAEYVRMSTDHQKYSTENQADAIRQYAATRGIEIVRTYADAGKSGLKIEGRDGCCQTNCNWSPIGAVMPWSRSVQAMSDCHSAKAAERLVL